VLADAAVEVPVPDRVLDVEAGRHHADDRATGIERAFVAVTEGLGMAEIKVGERVALSLNSRRIYLFDRDGRRIAGV